MDSPFPLSSSRDSAALPETLYELIALVPPLDQALAQQRPETIQGLLFGFTSDRAQEGEIEPTTDAGRHAIRCVPGSSL